MLARIVAPANEPLNLTETKHYLRVDHGHDDALITDLITAARMYAEHWLRRSLITQSWKLSYDDFLPDQLSVPMGPVISITSVTKIHADQSTELVPSQYYNLNAAKDTLITEIAIEAFRIEIVYQAGYGGSSAVPRPIKHGMLAHIAAMYDMRGDMDCSKLPTLTEQLYIPFREFSL
jgi:uncharacterized phiE125 gp8 family phage protein